MTGTEGHSIPCQCRSVCGEIVVLDTSVYDFIVENGLKVISGDCKTDNPLPYYRELVVTDNYEVWVRR